MADDHRRRAPRELTTVIFDMDDTLIDWSQRTMPWDSFQRVRAEGLLAWLADQGARVPEVGAFAGTLSLKVQEVWDEAKRDWSAARLDEALARSLDVHGIDAASLDSAAMLRAYNWEPIPGVVPFPDAHDVLEALRRRGFRLGLITNSFTPMWMRDIELEAYGLLEYFPVRITSGDTGYMKPHPAIFQRALDLLGVSPYEAAYVGDRPANDIVGANEIGMFSIFMSPPHLERELGDVVPDVTIGSLSELLDLV